MGNVVSLSKYRSKSSFIHPMVNIGPGARWSVNPDNSGLILSSGWQDMYGEESLELVRQGWIYLVHPDHRLKSIQRWLAGRLSEQPYQSCNVTLIHGVYRPVVSWVAPARDSHGTLVRWEGFNQVADDQAVSL